MPSKIILMPVPSYGFDPSESAIPWKLLVEAGHSVVFATPNGQPAQADRRMLTGQDLGFWKSLLRARVDAVAAYTEMSQSPNFQQPLTYADIRPTDFDALLLPGGHDKGVREYLESKILHETVVASFAAHKTVAAICHGVVLAARSIDLTTQKSVLYERKTTALLRSQERLSYFLTKHTLGDYYLTYPETSVQEEVIQALATPTQFVAGPLPLFRDSLAHPEHGFTVRDGEYLSARWPGDAYRFGLDLIAMLQENK